MSATALPAPADVPADAFSHPCGHRPATPLRTTLPATLVSGPGTSRGPSRDRGLPRWPRRPLRELNRARDLPSSARRYPVTNASPTSSLRAAFARLSRRTTRERRRVSLPSDASEYVLNRCSATRKARIASPRNSRRSLLRAPALRCVSARMSSPGSPNEWPSRSASRRWTPFTVTAPMHLGAVFQSIALPIRFQSIPWPKSQFIQMRNALPMSKSSDTVPQYRLSRLLSRLSPSTK